MITVNGRENGAALVVVAAISFILIAAAGALMSQVVTRIKTDITYDETIQATYAADAGLEQVKYYVKNSTYDTYGNIWLSTNSSPTGFTAINDLQVCGCGAAQPTAVDVVITDIGGGFYRAVATATQPSGRAASTAIEIKGRDLFSKYMFFWNVANLNVGTTTVRGDVHSNWKDNFYYGNARMYGNVTAVQGIYYYSGASPSNTYFYKDVDGYVSVIPNPTTAQISTLHDTATGPYQVDNTSPYYAGFGSFNTEIILSGTSVTITAKNPGTGAILTTGNYPLPDNDLIFVQGPVTKLEGNVNGRVTIATMSSMNITNSIKYIDAEGDSAYQLYQNGNPISDTPSGVAWTEPTYQYLPNPNYNPATPSNVGLMAVSNIVIADSAPYNVQLHAAILSSNGDWHAALGLKKGNLRVLGSMVTNLGGYRYSGSGYGYAKSGEYIYDQNLLTYPPAYYLGLDRPTFSAWRRM